MYSPRVRKRSCPPGIFLVAGKLVLQLCWTVIMRSVLLAPGRQGERLRAVCLLPAAGYQRGRRAAWEAVDMAVCHRLYWPAQLGALLQHMHTDTVFSLILK